MKFVVKYSKEKDSIPYLNNFWKSSWVDYGGNRLEMGKKYLPADFLDTLNKAETKDKAIEILLNYWKSVRNKYFKSDTDLVIKWYTRILNEEKDFIIKPLEKAYGKKFPFKNITVYLTTAPSCPYNYEKKWYMIHRNSQIMNLFNVSIHELNHFMFYYYWRQYLIEKGLNNNQIEYLKESFTVLTSSKPNENEDKPNILPIQNFVKENKDKSAKEIIDLVLQNKILDQIK